MVVRYLYKFVENFVPGGHSTVSLLDMIRKAAEGGMETPKVVIDASSLVAAFSAGLNTICNGQSKQLRQRIVDFVAKIDNAGGKVVVFFQGSDEYQSHDLWQWKRMEKLKGVHEAFDKIKRGERIEEGPLQLSSAWSCAFFTLHSIQSCEVYFSVRECDEAIVEYVSSNHNCIAIVGQDTDYMIYNKLPPFLIISTIEMDSLIFQSFEKEALLKYLNLRPEQLPLLASLLGNEIVCYENLATFHLKLINSGRRGYYVRAAERNQVFTAVANYVQSQKTPPELYEDIPKISRFVCGSEDLTLPLTESVKMYYTGKECKEIYIENDTMTKIVEYATELKRTGKFINTLHNVLCKNQFAFNNSLEDFRNSAFKPMARTLRPLRKKLYEVLLQESGVSEVTEWCVEGVYSSVKDKFTMEPVIVRLNFSQVEQHPGLLKLWDPEADIPEVKWSLFCGAVSEDLQPAQLQALPQEFVLPTMALFYLANELLWALFEDSVELKSFVVVALRVGQMSVEELEAIEIHHPDPRALQLSSIYLSCIYILELLNNTCGNVVPFDALCSSKYYDGKLFQRVYASLKEGNSEEEDKVCGDPALLDIYTQMLTIIQKL